MSIEDLVSRGQQQGLQSMVLADINNTSAALDFVSICREKGIRPVCGVDCRNGDQWLYTCIARNKEGFREINEFLSEYNLQEAPLPSVAPDFSNVIVIYPAGTRQIQHLREYEYIGVRPHDVNKVCLGTRNKEKLLAIQLITFNGPGDYELHVHLRAVAHNTLLSMLQPCNIARPDEYFIPTEQIKIFYSNHPELLKNAQQVMDECDFSFDFKCPKNKQVFGNSRYEDSLLLEKLAVEGMHYRYGKENNEAQKRIKNELKIINDQGFLAYFLITWDIIRYARSRGIYHVGRGSGGNSIVAYCLGITDIDPIELNLYFERFINPQRTSPPDFDIDFSWKDRDHIHAYVFNKYGRKHTALLGSMNTFKDSSILRELGKAYGLPKGDIDALVENPSSQLVKNDITDKIIYYGGRLYDFPHHRSIHAGGVLVSELPIYYYSALDLPPKGLPTTQWDMYTAEAIGFEKLDILSQRGLGHIKECAEIVKKNKGIDVDIHRVSDFMKDPSINQRLYEGEAIGCFYIESPAMRGLLKKLKCDNYLSLVAASSIIRPGVAKSGMMREYIKRFHDPASVKYLHPAFEEHLRETFGVMVYQEDVIKIAHYFAGLTLADGDILRRAMSGKFRSKKEFDRITETFFSNCRERGIDDSLAQEVWRQMSSFAGYAFCKAHSASYAVESYQSLYLKTYFPNEFHVAVINNFGGFYRTWVYVNEARRNGANINLPDINKSEYLTCIHGNNVYLGWVHVKNLEEKLAKKIVEEREKNGDYKDMFDFAERIAPGMEQLITLIKTGAFRSMGKSKKELMWAQLMKDTEDPVTTSPRLFTEALRPCVLPALRNNPVEDAYDEFELLGFPVSMTKFDLLKTAYRGNTFAHDLIRKTGTIVRMVGDLVAIKYVQTVKQEIMHFGSFLDVNGEFFDTVHFPDTLKEYPFTGYGVYLLEGKVVEEFGYPSVEIRKMARLPYKPDPRTE